MYKILLFFIFFFFPFLASASEYEHEYYYNVGSSLYRVTSSNSGAVLINNNVRTGITGKSLIVVNDDYVVYANSANSLYRINRGSVGTGSLLYSGLGSLSLFYGISLGEGENIYLYNAGSGGNYYVVSININTGAVTNHCALTYGLASNSSFFYNSGYLYYYEGNTDAQRGIRQVWLGSGPGDCTTQNKFFTGLFSGGDYSGHIGFSDNYMYFPKSGVINRTPLSSFSGTSVYNSNLGTYSFYYPFSDDSYIHSGANYFDNTTYYFGAGWTLSYDGAYYNPIDYYTGPTVEVIANTSNVLSNGVQFNLISVRDVATNIDYNDIFFNISYSGASGTYSLDTDTSLDISSVYPQNVTFPYHLYSGSGYLATPFFYFGEEKIMLDDYAFSYSIETPETVEGTTGYYDPNGTGSISFSGNISDSCPVDVIYSYSSTVSSYLPNNLLCTISILKYYLVPFDNFDYEGLLLGNSSYTANFGFDSNQTKFGDVLLYLLLFFILVSFISLKK